MPGTGIGISPMLSRNSGGGVPPQPTDPDLVAYMTALGIAYDSTVYNSGTPQQITGINYWLAWDKFFKDLKGTGAINNSVDFYSHIIALHAPLYTTAARNKWNLVNPVDSDAAFRLDIQGTWEHTPTGMIPDGLTAYANTFVIPTTHLNGNNTLWGCYNGTPGVSSTDVDMGCSNSGLSPSWALMTNYSGGVAYFNVNNYSETVANEFGTGANFVNRPGSDVNDGYLRGIKVKTGSQSAAVINYPFFLCGINSGGTPDLPYGDVKQKRFSYFFNQSFSEANILLFTQCLDSLLQDLGAFTNMERATFEGDSITFGLSASSTDLRWTSLVSLDKTWWEVNNGISGSTLQSSIPVDALGSANLYDRRSSLATYQAGIDAAIFISFGVNDCGAGGNGVGNYSNYTSAVFGTQLGTIIDVLVSKGWPLSKIVVKVGDFITNAGMTAYVPPVSTAATTTEFLSYRNIAASVSATKGNVFIDPFTYMSNNGGSSLLADGRHPNNTGHAVEAEYILTQITTL